MKSVLLHLWLIASHIKYWIRFNKFIYERLPIIGRPIAMILDRILLIIYGVDVTSQSIAVHDLRLPHPGGVLLGGNGIKSAGSVVVNAGVKFIARSPKDPEYLARHRTRSVYDLGSNIVIGTNTVVMGPVRICDDVVIGAMSLVNKDIIEPGTYVGCPARKISDVGAVDWF